MFRTAIMAFFLIISTTLQADDFIAGKDYVEINTATHSNSSKNSIELLEFFSYGCPWCYKLEAPMNKWLKGHPEVTLTRSPVVFHKEWEWYAKAFYTAKLLKLESSLSPKLFTAIQDEKQRLGSKDAMIAFFVAQGVDKATAQSAFSNSPTIDLEVKNGMKLMGQYRIQGVPAVVVQGKYKTDLQMAQSPERFFALLDFLVAKAKAAGAQ